MMMIFIFRILQFQLYKPKIKNIKCNLNFIFFKNVLISVDALSMNKHLHSESITKRPIIDVRTCLNDFNGLHRIVPYLSTDLNSSNLKIYTSFCRTHHFTSCHFVTHKEGQGTNLVVGTFVLNMANYDVCHDKKNHFFYLVILESTAEKKLAKLQYKWVRPGVVDLYHTEVPPEFQGQGIAKCLVLAGLDALCDENIIIKPTCSYVQKVLRENNVERHLNQIESGFKL